MLQGTLQDFTLPDVFSLLALTKKTGALTVTADGKDGRVFFRDGLICLALSDAKRVPLAARLVSAGLLDEEQVRQIIQQNSGSSLGVTEALVTSGHVEDRVLVALLREQIVDAVFELMRLDDGSFNFDGATPALSRGVGLSVVEVVGEANRRLEEWSGIRAQIASHSAILAMIPSAGGGSDGVTLNAEQWGLLSLIDGRRTVSDVVELTGRGEFATCRVLGDLAAAGLIQAIDPTSGGQTDLARLIAAREALRALESVGRTGGINPRLSSAAPLASGSQTRWLEPSKEQPTAEEKQPVRLVPKTRMLEEADASTPAPSVPDEPRPEVPEPISASTHAQEEQRQEPEPETEPPVAEAPAAVEQPALAGVDRASVARELASLGLDDDLPPSGGGPSLTRDSDVNKGLLLRLIDGVKGA